MERPHSTFGARRLASKAIFKLSITLKVVVAPFIRSTCEKYSPVRTFVPIVCAQSRLFGLQLGGRHASPTDRATRVLSAPFHRRRSRIDFLEMSVGRFHFESASIADTRVLISHSLYFLFRCCNLQFHEFRFSTAVSSRPKETAEANRPGLLTGKGFTETRPPQRSWLLRSALLPWTHFFLSGRARPRGGVCHLQSPRPQLCKPRGSWA